MANRQTPGAGFLPPYSPNLNLIERLWKFLRQKIINTPFFRTTGQFKTAGLDFFDRLPEFDQELASRLSLKFYILDSHYTSCRVQPCVGLLYNRFLTP